MSQYGLLLKYCVWLIMCLHESSANCGVEIIAASDNVDQAAALLTSARMMLRNTTKTIIVSH